VILLFTGSRALDPSNPEHVATVERLLLEVTDGQDGPHKLREGGAPGGDTIARKLAHGWGWGVDTVRADWKAPCRETCDHGPRLRGHDGRERCPAAGNYRNQAMVDLGADVGVAVPLRGAKNAGTRDCYKRAAAAGIRMAWGWAS
jgi:hypothetical protein